MANEVNTENDMAGRVNEINIINSIFFSIKFLFRC